VKVSYFYRSKGPGVYSVERLFRSIREHLPPEYETESFYCPLDSMRPDRILQNCREAKKHQGDLNHITGHNYYLAGALDGRKTLTTVLDLGNLRRLSGWRRSLFRYLQFSMPARKSRLLTAISQSTKDDLVKEVGVNPDKVRVVYVPVNEEFVPSPKPFNKSKPTVMLNGSVWNKNIPRQLQALEGIPCQVNLIGHPDDAIKEAITKSSLEVKVESGLTDAEVMLRFVNCDLVLFASLLEGFGMPIVEANAVGRAVITGDRTSMPEIAGNAAIIVDPTDVNAIRSAVLQVIEDDGRREELIEAGFRNVERFRAPKLAAEYAEIYREIV